MDDNKVTYFAETDSRNKRVPFGIKRKDRSRHTYVIGKTGMGKSTLLENMAIQDIQSGEGIAFIDPHGKTAELLLEYVPKERIKDVVYFAPFDLEYPISFNVMENVAADRRHLVANGLMATFEKIWVDAWSARMAYILNNTVLALLEYPGATLLGINRMLADKDFRKKVIENITDPGVRSFWVDEFAKYSERYAQEATPAIQNKVGQFTSNPLIRNIIGQSVSSFDIRKIMDEKKILIVNLSKGRVGEGNANLLGSMLITKIYLAAMSRADLPESEVKKLPNFYLYVDEFQSFANKSFADILSEARKYKLNLTIAHQYIEQMEEEVRAAVFGNVGTMIAFRVGAFDAEVLEKEFAPQFTATDLVNLGIFQIYLKLMIDGVSSQPFSASTMAPIPKPSRTYVPEVIASSRSQFAEHRPKVEEDIRAWHQPVAAPVPTPGENPKLSSRSAGFSEGQRSSAAPAGAPSRAGAPSSPAREPVADRAAQSPQRKLQDFHSRDRREDDRNRPPRRDKPLAPSAPSRPRFEEMPPVLALQPEPGSGVPQKLSLNDLKTNAAEPTPDRHKKEQAVRNVNALKEALAQIVKDAKSAPSDASAKAAVSADRASVSVPAAPAPVAAPAAIPAPVAAPAPAAPVEPKSTEPKKTGEVSEAVLKDALRLDE